MANLTESPPRYQMFEPNMDEYLDEEVEAVKSAFDVICKDWDQEVSAITACAPWPRPHGS